jgi:hypothetical protein
VLGVLVGLLVLAAPATAQSGEPFRPWNGRIPFKCELQYVGTGTNYPHPRVDPFCVEYDKTRQNVTTFGLADFLAKEPARVATAVPKCFYFQRDHWTGSIVQGGQRKLWHWDGNYFFDKAKGIGGVSIYNFRVGGEAVDPSPFAPPDLKPYLHRWGGGGVMLRRVTASEPSCRARVDTLDERRRVYRGWYRLATR